MSKSSVSFAEYKLIQKAIAIIPSDIEKTHDPKGKGKGNKDALKRAIKLSQNAIIDINEPIRTIHHLSCTGGTLLTKCIASMSNTLVLNELDPLSPLSIKDKSTKFTPTDIISLVKQNGLLEDQDGIISLFTSALKAFNNAQNELGRVLVVRDHSHSHFLTGSEIANRPSMLEMVKLISEPLALISVRNPVDSFLSMQLKKWETHFTPSNFNEYCRRYKAFLDHYENLPIVRYEDFVLNPHDVMQQICEHLNLRYFGGFEKVYNSFQFSGDSGRSGGKIASRPSREMSSDFKKTISASEYYVDVIKRLGYCPIT